MAIKKMPIDALRTEHDGRKRKRDLAGLIAGLQDEEAQSRRRAAHDLAELAPSDHAEAVKALLAQLKLEQQSSVRGAIFTTLTRIGDSDAVNGLVECLSSEDTVIRNEAVEALKQLPEAIAPIMQQLLQDANPDLRIFAVNVMESLRHPNVESWLIDVITHDTHINVCATAVDLLGEVGSGAAKPALLALRERFSDEPYICFAADLALKRLGEE